MPRRAAVDGDFAAGIAPARPGNRLTGGAIPDLPVFQRLGAVVQLELRLEVARQRVDGHPLPLRQHGVGDQEGLLLCVRVGLGKGVVLPYDADRGIDAIPRRHDSGRQLRAVAVADHVRAPLFRQLKRQRLIPRLSGQREAASIVCLCHPPSPALSVLFPIYNLIITLLTLNSYKKTALNCAEMITNIRCQAVEGD